MGRFAPYLRFRHIRLATYRSIEPTYAKGLAILATNPAAQLPGSANPFADQLLFSPIFKMSAIFLSATWNHINDVCPACISHSVYPIHSKGFPMIVR